MQKKKAIKTREKVKAEGCYLVVTEIKRTNKVNKEKDNERNGQREHSSC